MHEIEMQISPEWARIVGFAVGFECWCSAFGKMVEFGGEKEGDTVKSSILIPFQNPFRIGNNNHH